MFIIIFIVRMLTDYLHGLTLMYKVMAQDQRHSDTENSISGPSKLTTQLAKYSYCA